MALKRVVLSFDPVSRDWRVVAHLLSESPVVLGYKLVSLSKNRVKRLLHSNAMQAELQMLVKSCNNESLCSELLQLLLRVLTRITRHLVGSSVNVLLKGHLLNLLLQDCNWLIDDDWQCDPRHILSDQVSNDLEDGHRRSGSSEKW